MTQSRVLIADDLPPVLATVAALLAGSFDVVAMEADGRAALNSALRLKPDLLVLDISMPLLSGIEVAQELKRIGDRAKIVFLTLHEAPDILEPCRGGGVYGA